MKYIDLTQTFTQSMPTYPGDQIIPKLEQIASFEKDGWTDYKLQTSLHVGTHIETPLHMSADGKKLTEYDVSYFFGPGKLLDARGKKTIDTELLAGANIEAGDIVLVLTGWGEKFRQPEYLTDYPQLTQDFAEKLAASKPKMLGLDTMSPDQEPFARHKTLFSQGMMIIENLTGLEKLVGVDSFEVIALPAKFEVDGGPVRVVAKIK